MENEFSKHIIYVNYLSMPGQDFPIDCETLAALQNNTPKLAVIAAVAGCDRLVLTGCKVSGSHRTEGYVFVKSTEKPITGEILYHPEQVVSDYCHIEETPIDVTANTIEYREAYTQRYLASGNGNGAMLWSSFKNLDAMSLSALLTAITKEIADRKAAIEQAMSRSSVVFVRGMIMMWSGLISEIPEGWALCNGENGTPDLRDRFVVGAGQNYNVGSTGGADKVTLTTSEMPLHNHSARCANGGDHYHGYAGDDMLYDSFSSVTYYNDAQYSYDANSTFDKQTGRMYKTTSEGSHTHTVTIYNAGGGEAHENRPPYYALAFIMKL